MDTLMHEDPVCWERSLTGHPDLTQLRREIAAALAPLLSPSQVDDVLLVVSELMNNAYVHTNMPLSARVVVSRRQIRMRVTDGGTGTVRLLAPSTTRPSGRGLMIVQALATDWGVRPVTLGVGKTIWATLPRSESADS